MSVEKRLSRARAARRRWIAGAAVACVVYTVFKAFDFILDGPALGALFLCVIWAGIETGRIDVLLSLRDAEEVPADGDLPPVPFG